MAKKTEVDLGLPSLDDLFSSQKTRDEAELSKIQEIPLSEEEKPNQKERIVLRSDRIKNLIPKNLPVSQREEYIVTALQFYSKSKIKDRER